MRSTYARAMRGIHISEGGYVNHPKDPGGATNYGITQRVYDSYRKDRGQSARSVKQISADEVAAILPHALRRQDPLRRSPCRHRLRHP